MDLSDLQSQVDHWIRNHGVRYFKETTNTLILVEEVGELSRLIVRKYAEQSFKNPEDEKLVDQRIESEIADIAFVLVCLANQMGIDLNRAMMQNLEKKNKRDKDRHHNNPKLKKM